MFPLGSSTAKLTVTDQDGGSDLATVTVHVKEGDTTPPVITVFPGQAVEQTGPNGTVVTWVCEATDDEDGDVPCVCVPASGTGFQLGTTTVACAATDDSGYKTTKTLKVTIKNATCPGPGQDHGGGGGN